MGKSSMISTFIIVTVCIAIIVSAILLHNIVINNIEINNIIFVRNLKSILEMLFYIAGIAFFIRACSYIASKK